MRKHTLSLLSTFMISTVALGQAPPAGYNCDGHTAALHTHANDGQWGAYWKVISVRENEIYDEKENKTHDGWDRLVGLDIENPDCDPMSIDHTHTKTFLHRVSITTGAELSWESEGALRLLFTKLKGKVGAKVDWHHSGTSEFTEQFTIRVLKQLSECKKIKYAYEVRRIEEEIEIDIAESNYTCYNDSLKAYKTEDCNRHIISGEGRGYIGDARIRWYDSKKICKCDENGNVIPLGDGEGGSQ